MKFSGIALLSTAGVAAAQHHAHQHIHNARRGSPVAREAAAVVEYAAVAVATAYELNGELISYEEVEAGLESGKYVIVGDTITTVLPATSATTIIESSSASATASIEAAAFFEQKSSSSVTTTSTPASTTTTAAAAASTTASSSGGTGVDSDFPSGELDCSTFPSSYGAVYLDWLGLGGWSGVQEVPDYSTSDSSISTINTAVSGSTCTANSFCSYACPAGYQKSQWPTAQGSTGQSIGGLYCNSNGKLELSRTSVSTLCVAGVGGVTVTNNLAKTVSICRTDYPGTESETIPLEVTAGSTEAVCNPNSLTYYMWEGSYTTAQYYINPSGNAPAAACQWGSSGTNLGNWAPVNMGLGQSSTGITYLSLFQNSPTNTDGVLDFDISITGDVSGSCAYTGGKYYLNGVESSTGCTIAVTGSAVISFN